MSIAFVSLFDAFLKVGYTNKIYLHFSFGGRYVSASGSFGKICRLASRQIWHHLAAGCFSLLCNRDLVAGTFAT